VNNEDITARLEALSAKKIPLKDTVYTLMVDFAITDPHGQLGRLKKKRDEVIRAVEDDIADRLEAAKVYVDSPIGTIRNVVKDGKYYEYDRGAIDELLAQLRGERVD